MFDHHEEITQEGQEILNQLHSEDRLDDGEYSRLFDIIGILNSAIRSNNRWKAVCEQLTGTIRPCRTCKHDTVTYSPDVCPCLKCRYRRGSGLLFYPCHYDPNLEELKK